MTTESKTEIVTITTASRNLSLDWAIGQRDELACPKKRVGIRGIKSEIAEAKRVAGGLSYKMQLYVDGREVLGTEDGAYLYSDWAILGALDSCLEFGFVNVKVVA